MQALQLGSVNETTHCVEQRHLAPSWGSGLAPVLGTPALVAFCEQCARLCVDPLLPQGQQTVGTRIDLRHIAATPAGMSVTVRAELASIDDRRLIFKIEARDDLEMIGEAEHERYIVDIQRFMASLSEKAPQA